MKPTIVLSMYSTASDLSPARCASSRARAQSATKTRKTPPRRMKSWSPASVASASSRSGSRTSMTDHACRFELVDADCAAATIAVSVASSISPGANRRTER